MACSPDQAPLGLDFRASGFDAAVRRMQDDVEFIDLQGRTVVPGLVDCHAHLMMWAMQQQDADLVAASSEEEAVLLLKKHVGVPAPGMWVVGRCWSHNAWTVPKLPSRQSLDAAFPANPVVLTSKCSHLAWVNSVALRIAGLDASAQDPPGGEIERDAAGALTGILKENAMALVERHIPPPTHADRVVALRRAQKTAHSLGLTGIQSPEYLDSWDFLQQACASGDLTLRVDFWLPLSSLPMVEALKLRHGLGSNMLRIAAIKAFVDGSLGGRTALMHEAFEEEPGNFGIAVTDVEELSRQTIAANRTGLAMAVHAIGDKAVDMALSAFEAARSQLGFSGAAGTDPLVANRIEHFQVFSLRDLERIRSLRPVASVQPVHLCADMGPADRFWGARARYAYAFRTLADAGCTLAFGSDAPVEPNSPFFGMYAAVTRQSLQGEPPGGWCPEEKIGIEQALAAYTLGPAQAGGLSRERGSLAAGKLADFVVLAADPLRVEPQELRDLKAVSTWVGGRCVFDSLTE